MTVITVAFVSQDGKSNWLKGLTLVLAYVLLSASFFFHVDTQLAEESASQHEGAAYPAAVAAAGPGGAAAAP